MAAQLSSQFERGSLDCTEPTPPSRSYRRYPSHVALIRPARQRRCRDFIDDHQQWFRLRGWLLLWLLTLPRRLDLLYTPASTTQVTLEAMNINNVDIMHLKKGEVNLGVRTAAAPAR